MRDYFKKIASPILVPLTRWYLRKNRTYKYQNITVEVFSGVFHPGLFPSTKFLISYLNNQDLNHSHVLELGCGTGLISVLAAGKGAKVLASDLSIKAVENCELNAIRNNARIEVHHSDLFKNIPLQKLDWIIINPPYYNKPIANDEELAWHCGENFEYFQSLFSQLGEFIHHNSKVIMILTSNLDIPRIRSIASSFHFKLKLLQEQSALFDGKDLLFKIENSCSDRLLNG